MFAAALILYGVAFLCFLAVAGNVNSRINLLGLGLACIALMGVLNVLMPRVQ